MPRLHYKQGSVRRWEGRGAWLHIAHGGQIVEASYQAEREYAPAPFDYDQMFNGAREFKRRLMALRIEYPNEDEELLKDMLHDMLEHPFEKPLSPQRIRANWSKQVVDKSG